MNRDSLLLRLVLLVSCSHAMVHLLEQSIASVELNVSADYGFSNAESGMLSAVFRFPYGAGAILAGLLADRVGLRRILVLYLAGASITCIAIGFCPSATVIYGLLFVLGCFASIYHPAGLALLANSTTVGERSRALGVHGVFGSTGIAAAPFFAGLALSIPSITWRSYYLLLAAISGLLAWMLWRFLQAMPGSAEAKPAPAPAQPVPVATTSATHSTSLLPLSQTTSVARNGITPSVGNKPSAEASAEASAEPITKGPMVIVNAVQPAVVTSLQKFPFIMLILSTGTMGIVYGGFLHFLTRYLTESPELTQRISPSYFTAIALLCGAAGQYLAGWLARPARLPRLLALAYAGNAPLLWWMASAEGVDRLAATCLLAFVHFMNQPLYNSLLPEFIPPSQRSTWFGFSNMVGFGMGTVGAPLVGSFADYTDGYRWLAGISLIAALFPLALLKSTVRSH